MIPYPSGLKSGSRKKSTVEGETKMNHPIRRKDRELTDPVEIDRIFEKAVYGHLGLCDGGEPYVLPMNFGISKGAIYLHCASEGRKLDVARRNPRACFQVETDAELLPSPAPCGWGVAYRSAMVFGALSVVESEEEKAEALTAMMKKCAGEDFSQTFPPERLASVTVLRLDPDGRTGKARLPA